MDVRDAVASRFSCRAFLSTPVSLAVVRDILERAARAPSGGNLQPWRVDALSGPTLEALKALIRPRHGELPRGEDTEYPIYPSPLREPYGARRFEVGALLYGALGIPHQDRPARIAQYARNFEFFDAPVGLFVSLDRSMGSPQWSDLGGFIQTVLLLARAHGLHSCAQEAWTRWHKTVPPFLNLPSDHIVLRHRARFRRRGRCRQPLARSAPGGRPIRDLSRLCRVGYAAVLTQRGDKACRRNRG